MSRIVRRYEDTDGDKIELDSETGDARPEVVFTLQTLAGSMVEFDRDQGLELVRDILESIFIHDKES